MNAFDNLPTELIGLVLKELTGKTYDVHDANSLASAKSAFKDLLSSPEPEMLQRVIEAILRTSEKTESTSRLPSVELRLMDGPRETEEELLEDLPSRARPVLASQSRTRHQAVSPRELGFEAPAFGPRQPSPSVEQWEEFLLLAEKNIRTLSPYRRNERRNGDRVVLSWEHIAPNHEMVEIQRGQNVATAHFVFESAYVYFILSSEENVIYHSVATIEEADGFAKHVIKAFNGERDSANLALASIREAIAH